MAGFDTLAGGFDADQADAVDIDVGIEDAHRVGATADAGDHRIRLAAGHFRHLDQAFLADDLLEIAHQHRVGVRAGDRADDVEGVVDVGDPVAHRLVECVLQRLRAGFDRHDRGAEQLHAVDVGGLAADIFAAHVDHALHAVAGSDGGRRDPVLAGTGLGNDARLAHAASQHGLADAVVHLVGAGMVEVFALQVNLGATEQIGPALGVVDRRRTADEMLQFVFVFGAKSRIDLRCRIGGLQFIERTK